MISARFISAAAGLVVAGAALADAPRVYVNAAATGANTGASWANAFTDLQAALQSAPAGSEIWVAQGTYYPGPLNGSRSFTFTLRSGIALYGGFVGAETMLIQRNPAAYPTILSGDLGRNDPASPFDNAFQVVLAPTGVDSTAILDGFTIEAGYGSPGPGMYINAASPVVRSCLISGNAGVGTDGGAIAVSAGAAPTFIECRFENNRAQINAAGGPLAYNGASGGAVAVYNSTLTLTRCLFYGNRAGNGTVSGCDHGHPVKGGDGGHGGALALFSSTATLDGCRFVANAAGSGGMGGLQCAQGPSQPGIGGSGGAIATHASNLTLVSCVFDANRVGSGGSPSGIAGIGGAVAVLSPPLPAGSNATFFANIGGDLDPAFPLPNSISAACGVTDCPFVDPDGPDNIQGTPDDDFRLSTSYSPPLIDSGDNALVPAGFTRDAAGNLRFADIPGIPDTGVGTPPIVDRGAYEAQPPACRADFNTSGVVSVQDILDFITAYLAADPRADFNQSGAISVQDIFDFLAAYFAGC